MRKTTLSLGLGLLASLLAVPAFAATTITGNLTVQATVVGTCTLNTAAAAGSGNGLLNFGNVTSTIAAVNADTTTAGNYGLSVVCSATTPYTVFANSGANASGTQNNMKSAGGSVLPYNLYTSSARTTAFPITSGTALSFTGNGLAQTIPFYGQIPAGTTLPAPGAYTDTVVVSITY
jgi:spore coat protein U-like protein